MTTLRRRITTRRSTQPTQETVFYVSPRGDDQWSGRFPDPAPDGTDGPFATVGRARDAVRTLPQGRPRSPSPRVLLRGGTYFLPEPLALTAPDSGTEKQPVIFAAFAGERPILSGGQRITGWSEQTLNGQTCWVAFLPAVAAGTWNFTQLFVDGMRRPRPRLPKNGSYRFTGVVDEVRAGNVWGQGPAAALFAGEEIRPWTNLADVKLIALQLWFETHHRLRAVDPAQHRVSFHAKSLGGLTDEKIQGAYARYFVENVREALDSPGEWYLDRPTGKLYYLPLPGESMDATEVIAPRLPCLVRFAGTARRPVHHIHLENIALHHAEWDYPPDDPGSIQAAFKVPGAVVFDHAADCVLYGCEIAHLAQYGVEMTTGCAGNRIVACQIHDLGAGGVRIGHEWLDRVNETALERIKPQRGARPMAAVVSDCSIHDGSLIHLSAIGIWIGNAGHNRILRNHIFNLNYTGISCGWTWGYAPTATVANRIENNHIHHINWNRALSDNGGIYTLGVQPGTIVRGNHIHHVGCYGYGGWGIYPDEGSSEILFADNVVHHTDEAGFSTHYGRDNVVRNNIFALSGKTHLNPGLRQRHRSTTLERNIVLWRHGGFPPHDWRLGNYLLRDNLFWNGGGPLDLGSGTTVADWQKIGQHLGTIIADPLFADPAAGDFTLRADSPALQLGFQPVDAAQAGPRPLARRPVSFTAWGAEPDPDRPIVRTRLELRGGKTLRVTVENVGTAPATGRLALAAAPAELVSLGAPDKSVAAGFSLRGRSAPVKGAATGRAALFDTRNNSVSFAFQGLRPGSARSADFPIRIAVATETFWVETRPAQPNIRPALQFFTVRDPEWRIPRLEPLAAAHAVWAALANQPPRLLALLDRPIAEFRAAVAGDQLALLARIVDADPQWAKAPWMGSTVEIFSHDRDEGNHQTAAADGATAAEKIRIAYLVPAVGDSPAQGACKEVWDAWDAPPAPTITVDSRTTADGYEIAALLPLPLLRIAPASRRFGLELAVFTTLVKGQPRGRYRLCGAPDPYRRRDGCATVIPE